MIKVRHIGKVGSSFIWNKVLYSRKKQTLLDWVIEVRGLPPMAQKQERAMDGARSALDELRIHVISRRSATPVGN